MVLAVAIVLLARELPALSAASAAAAMAPPAAASASPVRLSLLLVLACAPVRRLPARAASLGSLSGMSAFGSDVVFVHY
jgi:hypothetical protein